MAVGPAKLADAGVVTTTIDEINGTASITKASRPA
jgi:hypothetical protein